MRVAYDAKRVFRNFTGLGNYCRSTLTMLETYYPDVEQQLFSPSLGREDARTLPFRDKAILPSGLMRGSMWRTFCMGREASAVADIFHGLSHELPYGLDIPSVVTMHDVAFRTYKDMYTPFDRVIYNRKWASACRRATHIIAISESTKRDVQRFYNVPDERISVVCQPVDFSFYDNLPADTDDSSPRSIVNFQFYNLYVGSINSRKNLLSIVQAMEMIPEERRLPLIIVGEGREYKARVQQYIASHSLEKWCHFMGHVGTLQELQTLYRGAHMFIYPSHYEGMGLPVIEAQLCGCPVITSNVSSLPEAGGDAAIQVPPTDVHALAEAIDCLTTDGALRHQLSVAGRERCMELFHPKKLAIDLMSIYNKVR